MKYLFIAGLEHSGTTLINHLICQHPRALGLGEVASFFSEDHMRQYIAKWGQYPDARLCSCGHNWDECGFWSELIELSGLHSALPLTDKYGRLFKHIDENYSHVDLVVDSSKSLFALKQILSSPDRLGLRRDDIFVLLAVKDVRNFATSVSRKNGSSNGFANCLRSFNWWLSENRNFLDFFDKQAIRGEIVLYERLCFDPTETLSRIWNMCDVGPESPEVQVEDVSGASKHRSHIAMGNKNFTVRNSSRLRYDSRWFVEDNVHLTYLMHYRARKFNKSLYLS